MDGMGHVPALPQPALPDNATWRLHQTAQASFRDDALSSARRETRIWRWGFFAAALGMAGMGVAVAGLVTRHTEHWGVIIADTETRNVRVLADMHSATQTLPASIDDWFMERYVAMREGWTLADARSAFDAVACMSDPDEQKRFAAWHSLDKRAPQQVFTKARHGWRQVTTLAAPGTEGVARDGARRVAVPFSWEDKGLSDTAPPRATGVARFTVRKDAKARQPCNPTGLIVSEYSRQLDREPAP